MCPEPLKDGWLGSSQEDGNGPQIPKRQTCIGTNNQVAHCRNRSQSTGQGNIGQYRCGVRDRVAVFFVAGGGHRKSVHALFAGELALPSAVASTILFAALLIQRIGATSFPASRTASHLGTKRPGSSFWLPAVLAAVCSDLGRSVLPHFIPACRSYRPQTRRIRREHRKLFLARVLMPVLNH